MLALVSAALVAGSASGPRDTKNQTASAASARPAPASTRGSAPFFGGSASRAWILPRGLPGAVLLGAPVPVLDVELFGPAGFSVPAALARAGFTPPPHFGHFTSSARVPAGRTKECLQSVQIPCCEAMVVEVRLGDGLRQTRAIMERGARPLPPRARAATIELGRRAWCFGTSRERFPGRGARRARNEPRRFACPPPEGGHPSPSFEQEALRRLLSLGSPPKTIRACPIRPRGSLRASCSPRASSPSSHSASSRCTPMPRRAALLPPASPRT